MTQEEKSIQVLAFGGGANNWQAAINARLPDVPVTVRKNRSDLTGEFANVNCLVGFNIPDSLFDQLPKLEWIQCMSVGVDKLTGNPRIPAHVRITNTQRLYGDAIAEYVIWAMLTLSRRFHTMLYNQAARKWQQVFGDTVSGKTIGIVGVGDVGRNVAERVTALHMRTIGFVKNEEQAAEVRDMVDEVVLIEKLAEHVAELDTLVLCVPLTSATSGLVDRNIVQRMKRSAILINVARAGLIDDAAVIDALKTNRIAGAAMDVFPKEPLPRWSRLWKMKNLLVTPHTSAMTSDYKKRVADLLSDNVMRFVDGRPLRNEIDRSIGY